MSDKRRRKLEKRRQRSAKRERNNEARLEKTLVCPNCGDRYRLEPTPEAFHRNGPCDCDPATRRKAEAFVDKRAEEYDNAPGGRIACRTCATMHGESRQQTIFFEGRLVWDGCESCVETERTGKLFAIYDAHRDKWFGQDRPRLAEDVAARESDAAAREKFVKPFLSGAKPDDLGRAPLDRPIERRESINDSSQIYGGGFQR